MRICAFVFFVILAGCAAPFSDAPLYRPSIVDSATLPASQTSAQTPVAPVAALQSPLFTLDRCIATALNNHRSLRMADRRIDMANDMVDEAWTAQLPQIRVAGQYEVRDRQLTASFMGQSIALSERRGGSISAYAQLLLYDFGKTSEQRNALRSQVAVAEHNAEKARQDMAFAVSQAYLYVLEMQKLKAVTQESLRVLQVQLQTATEFLAQGLVNKSDALSVDVRLAERKQELIRLEHNVHIARSTLSRLMGIALDQNIELAEVEEGSMWQGSWVDALRQALAARPDLVSLRHHVASVQADYRSLFANLAPTIALYGQGYYPSEESFAGQKGISAGITMQWSFFDGGATYKRLQRKQKEIAEMRDLYAEKADDIALEVKKSYLALDDAAERIPVARQVVGLAEENLRLTREQYAQGLVTSADVLTEEDRFARAQVNYYQAVYGYHQAFAEWLHALGSKVSLNLK